jgi:hypothetical protein
MNGAVRRSGGSTCELNMASKTFIEPVLKLSEIACV